MTFMHKLRELRPAFLDLSPEEQQLIIDKVRNKRWVKKSLVLEEVAEELEEMDEEEEEEDENGD